MKVEIKIPRGWRRVTRGKVKKGDRLSVIFHGPQATAGSWRNGGWEWTLYRGEWRWVKPVGESVRNFHCVIRRAT